MPSDLPRRTRGDSPPVDRRERDRDRDRRRGGGSRRSRTRSPPVRSRSPEVVRKRARSPSLSPVRDGANRYDLKRLREDRQRSDSRERKDRDRDRRKEPVATSSSKSSRRRESEEDDASFHPPPMMAMTGDDDEAMAAMMGFSTFDSTKGKKVEGNDVGMAEVAKKRKYRQYMNRRGGFNRPLDAVH